MSDGPVYEGELDAVTQARQEFESELAQIKAAALAEAGAGLAELTRQATGSFALAVEERKALAMAELAMRGQVYCQSDFVITGEMENAGTLELPFDYLPERHSLLVFRNGKYQAEGRDWRPASGEGIPCVEIQINYGTAAGDVWSFVLLPDNANQAALDAAEQAAMRAREAEEALVECRNELAAMRALVSRYESEAAVAARAAAGNALVATQELGESVDVAADSAALAEQWARASASSAEDAWAASAEAYKAKTLAEQAAARPGIKAVPDIGQINGPGVYIVIPELGEPTGFMGLYPAKSVEDMNFDGVFFIAKEAELPEFPLPAKPLPAAQVQALGNYESWQPCAHRHTGGE